MADRVDNIKGESWLFITIGLSVRVTIKDWTASVEAQVGLKLLVKPILLITQNGDELINSGMRVFSDLPPKGFAEDSVHYPSELQ